MIITKEKVIEFGAWLTGHDEETVAELLNPEYWALQEILETL